MAIDSAPTSASAAPPLLYLLRVWPGESAFRAVLCPVGSTEPCGLFGQPEQLTEFLCRLRPAVDAPPEETRMKLNVALAAITVASALLSSPGVQAAPVPATGGYIEIHSQDCKVGGQPAPCFVGTDFAPYGIYQQLTFFGQTYSMYAGAAVNANHLKADIDGTELGGRVTASFVDVYTLHGPAGDPLSFTASLTVTGTRSPLANTAIGFGLPGRGTFIAGSMLHYFRGTDPGVVAEVLTLTLDDIDVGSTFSFSTIVDLLVNSGQTAFFGSTAVLGFSLPDGYFVTSQYGFSGPGSAQPPVGQVPLPGSLALVTGGLLGVAVARRRGRFAGA